MTAHRIGSTTIHLRPITTTLAPGDHIRYIPPTPDRSHRPGVIRAISGASALVAFDDCLWLQWAPLERLRSAPSADGSL